MRKDVLHQVESGAGKRHRGGGDLGRATECVGCGDKWCCVWQQLGEARQRTNKP